MKVKITYINPKNLEDAISNASAIESFCASKVDLHIIFNEQKKPTADPYEKSYDLGKAYKTISRFIREKRDPHCSIVITGNNVTVIREESHLPIGVDIPEK